jgi:hypothetical protein
MILFPDQPAEFHIRHKESDNRGENFGFPGMLLKQGRDLAAADIDTFQLLDSLLVDPGKLPFRHPCLEQLVGVPPEYFQGLAGSHNIRGRLFAGLSGNAYGCESA